MSNLYKRYAKIIASNAETCSDIELLTKYLGYFVGGKKKKLKYFIYFFKKCQYLHFAPDKNLNIEKLLQLKCQLSFLGKFSDNYIFTEGLLSLSNLLVIANDQIIKREVYKQEYRTANINSEEHKLKLFLTVLENVEVLIEITSKKILGDTRKFIVIFIIQGNIDKNPVINNFYTLF